MITRAASAGGRVYYAGSFDRLGNFEPPQAGRLLGHFATLLGEGSRLLIGIDQPKAVAKLEAAYNDAAGWSAAFALNLLGRLNRELGGDFDPDGFVYQAHWAAGDRRASPWRGGVSALAPGSL